jgi:threonine aldolase
MSFIGLAGENSVKKIDLRSDTVTLPTDEMREAMARADLGDDGYAEDPTVNRLEATAAALMGKQAAVLLPSGTMGNLAAMIAHCPRGTKAFLGSEAHSCVYEGGGAAALGGILMTPVRNTADGELDLDALRAELERPSEVHFAEPAMVALENTHNLCGGTAVEVSHMAAVFALARSHSLSVHLDGARIFNAAIALGATPKEIASFADSVSFCLSKGLACPIGSLLCGTAAFAIRVRRIRKMLGGAMRQAGIVAAAGIVALSTMVDRLAEDHINARKLADMLNHKGYEVVVVRKVGAPEQPELGIGAIVDGDHPEAVFDERLIEEIGVTQEYLRHEVQRQLKEIHRRQQAYRAGRPRLELEGRTVIIVDDGIATGGSIRAALRGVKRAKPRKIVLAVPVAPDQTLASLRGEADEIVCLGTPPYFYAVGQFYGDFHQVSDEEVIRTLESAARARPAPRAEAPA